MVDLEKQLSAAIVRVPEMDRQALLTTRANALRHGDAARELVAAIDARLAELDEGGSIAQHRLNFARAMLRKLEREPPLRWVAARDLFQKAKLEDADNPFAIWMEGNTARQIPLTKALEEIRPEFPNVEHRKDGAGQGDRVYYRRTK